MLASSIEQVIVDFGSANITELFIVFMLVLFLLAILLRIVGKQHAFRQYTPTLLTSIGILGTFCGIVAGLLGFDVNSIDTSIDMLLAGMKTAFTTSLVGMGLSILYKLSSSLSCGKKRRRRVR